MKPYTVQMSGNLVSFSILAIVLVLIPGLDFTLVIRYATTQSKRSALAVALGINTGLLVWGTFASFGISSILQTSQVAFNVLRLMGICYMVAIGIGFIIQSFKIKEAFEVSTVEKGIFKTFYKGLLTNLLNPKAGVFYISVLPQFIPADQNHVLFGLLLTVMHTSISVLYFIILIFFIDRMRKYFQNPTFSKYLERISGVTVIGFGLKLLSSNSNT